MPKIEIPGVDPAEFEKKSPWLFVRRYILAGILIWLPIWVTLLVLKFVIGILDSGFALLPQDYQPEQLFGFYIPGLGILISIIIIFLTGMLATNILGRRLMLYAEKIVQRIPFVRAIYSATKQLTETLFTSTGDSFRKVVLIEYPRKGIWSIAFQSGNSAPELDQKTGVSMITVFIPTTPNPTSGFMMLVPKTDVIELDMSIDQALKFVISLGVVQPNSNQHIVIPADKNSKTIT